MHISIYSIFFSYSMWSPIFLLHNFFVVSKYFIILTQRPDFYKIFIFLIKKFEKKQNKFTRFGEIWKGLISLTWHAKTTKSDKI